MKTERVIILANIPITSVSMPILYVCHIICMPQRTFWIFFYFIDIKLLQCIHWQPIITCMVPHLPSMNYYRDECDEECDWLLLWAAVHDQTWPRPIILCDSQSLRCHVVRAINLPGWVWCHVLTGRSLPTLYLASAVRALPVILTSAYPWARCDVPSDYH